MAADAGARHRALHPGSLGFVIAWTTVGIAALLMTYAVSCAGPRAPFGSFVLAAVLGILQGLLASFTRRPLLWAVATAVGVIVGTLAALYFGLVIVFPLPRGASMLEGWFAVSVVGLAPGLMIGLLQWPVLAWSGTHKVPFVPWLGANLLGGVLVAPAVYLLWVGCAFFEPWMLLGVAGYGVVTAAVLGRTRPG